MKDSRIRYNAGERAAVLSYGVKCFCLASQTLPAEEMARRFIRSLDAIGAACATNEGAFIYAVYETSIRRLEVAT